MGILSRIGKSVMDEQLDIFAEESVLGNDINAAFLRSHAKLAFRQFTLPVRIPAKEIARSVRNYFAPRCDNN
jgi:hypothetical protein